jgi:hypothetical protein
MAYLQELQLDTKGFSKFWAAAGAANATTRATAITSFFMGDPFRVLANALRIGLTAKRRGIGVVEILGQGGRGKRDNQGNGDQKLLHSESPLGIAGLDL